jgi:hypothetical protein
LSATNQAIDRSDALTFAMWAAGTIVDNANRGRSWEAANDAQIRQMFPESQGYFVRFNRAVRDASGDVVRLGGNYGRPDWTVYKAGRLVAVVEAGDGQIEYLAEKTAKVDGLYVRLARAATGGQDVLIIKYYRVRPPTSVVPSEAGEAGSAMEGPGSAEGGIDFGLDIGGGGGGSHFED